VALTIRETNTHRLYVKHRPSVYFVSELKSPIFRRVEFPADLVNALKTLSQQEFEKTITEALDLAESVGAAIYYECKTC